MSILFLEDWTNEEGKPVACVHRNTKNASFLRMAVLLSRMNIKNNLFHLCLYDPALLDVDPHELNATNDPTGELRMRVAVESKRNVWYYLREVIRIPVSGSDPIKFNLNRGNLAMTWCFVNFIDFNGTQPRQTGKMAPLHTKVKIPGGWTTMGEVKPGDLVTASDGTNVFVKGVYPQGKKPVYRFTFQDGRSTLAGIEHLWKVHNTQWDGSGEKWKIITTRDIIAEMNASLDTRAHLVIPTCIPEQTCPQTYAIDPYVLGTKLSNTKSIPERYMRGAPEQRRALLDGLLSAYGYRITSDVLAEQVQELVRGLGGICSRTEYGVYPQFAESDEKKDEFNLAITSVEYAGEEECQCIEIDHPDHLYVTDDYIVTHNTIGAIALSSWVEYVSGYNMTIGMLTHSDKLVQENVKRLKDMRDALPEYMVFKSGSDIDNKQGLDYKALNNKYLTYIGQKDKIAANKVGRGSTAPVLHFDELAFIPNIKITFPAIMASTNTARKVAAKSGQMHSNIYTTTAGDPSTEEGEFALEILNKAMPFTEKLFDCKDIEAAHKMVATNSENKLVDGTFSYLQLGLTHEWFADTIARNNVPPDEIQRDYLNNWITLAKHPIIAKEILQRMNEFKKPDPEYTEVFGEYIVNWYVPRHVVTSHDFKRKSLILGMDCSEMIGRDFTTFVCIDPTDMSVVMTFRCNESNTMKIALFVSDILTSYPRMLFVPERKSTAITIIDTVIVVMQKQGQNPFTRIFNKIVDQNDLKEFTGINIHDPSLCETAARKYLGFMTTGTTRPVLYKQVLQKAANMSSDRIYDPVLVNELAGLQAENGRIDHKVGGHDDMVIAWLLACYVIFEGKNLHLYGISSEEILKSIDKSTGNKIDPAHLANQMRLRKQVKEYENLIKTAETDYLRQHFKYKLSQMAQYLDESITLEPISKDSLRKDYSDYGDVYKRAQDVSSKPVVDLSQIFRTFGNYNDRWS